MNLREAELEEMRNQRDEARAEVERMRTAKMPRATESQRRCGWTLDTSCMVAIQRQINSTGTRAPSWEDIESVLLAAEALADAMVEVSR